MAIVIEEATAEAIFEALREVAPQEKQKLRALLDEREETAEEEEAWHQISAAQVARFYKQEGEE